MEPLFDLSEKYDRMLAEGLALSGEGKEFFLEGRLELLSSLLPDVPARVLDFGCGIGDSTARLSTLFPSAQVTGIDTSVPALERARKVHRSPRRRFLPPEELAPDACFDLAYVNGVFHHIAPARRAEAVSLIRGALAPGGRLAFFENNPLNPGARMVMKRIPFDRDAVMIGIGEARELLARNGFRVEATRTLFYFPRLLSFLRVVEPPLQRLPLGAQYLVLAEKI